MARRGKPRTGAAGKARLRPDGSIWRGRERLGRRGTAATGGEWCGGAGQASPGNTWHGVSRYFSCVA